MPAYLGGGGLPKGAPIPGSTNYGGIPSGIGSGTGGGPVTFPNYGTVGGSGGGSNAMLAAGGTGVDLYSNGQPVTQFGGTPVPVSGGGGIGSVTQSLITPGLVPDVARQGAELAAGRGVGGSPAGASTAVRMSEQNYQQRLALANALLTGESQRRLPYDITPFQQQQLALQQQQLQLEREIAAMRYPHNVLTGFRGPSNTGRGGYGGGYLGNQIGNYSNPGNFAPGIGPLGGNRIGGGLGGGSSLFGGGGGGQPLTLDDIYDELGFGDFGNLPGDQTTEPPDYSYDMWD